MKSKISTQQVYDYDLAYLTGADQVVEIIREKPHHGNVFELQSRR
jgi:hypothetical protein